MSSPTDLKVGGFTPLSSVDWPDQLVATVFAQGCPWDCVYCHNPHLIPASTGACVAAAAGGSSALSWTDVVSFLESRRGLLDGVVFTGGEPLLQTALAGAVRDVRALGFSVGLHTGGSHPDRLEGLLADLDWIGLDVKAPFAAYERVTRRRDSGQAALRSLRLVVSSGVAFEARTTVHPGLLDERDLEVLADELADEGVRAWALQTYRPQGARSDTPRADRPLDLDTLAAGFADRFVSIVVR